MGTTGKTVMAIGRGFGRGALGAGSVLKASGSGASIKAAGAVQAAGVLLVLNGNFSQMTVKAGESSISALRCIIMRGGAAYVASSDDASCANAICGVSKTAANAQGAEFVVQTGGVLEDASFDWQDDLPIFCGPDGRLTQTPPTSGFWQIVGVPISTTRMLINLQEATNF